MYKKETKETTQNVHLDGVIDLQEIRKAFFDAFHKKGELWFSYLGSEEDCQQSTESYWQEFLEELSKRNTL